MLLKNKKKTVLAFFYYNSLKVAVMIPQDSCYHSFFGSIGTHQTSFPVTFDGEIVRYNDNDLYILAWGAGSAASGSSRKKFLKDRNFHVAAKRVSNADITRWLESNAEGRQRNVARRELN